MIFQQNQCCACEMQLRGKWYFSTLCYWPMFVNFPDPQTLTGLASGNRVWKVKGPHRQSTITAYSHQLLYNLSYTCILNQIFAFWCRPSTHNFHNTLQCMCVACNICVCFAVRCIYIARWQLGERRGPVTYQHQQMDRNSPIGETREWLHLTATVFHIEFILFTVVMRYVTVLLIHFCVLSSACNAYRSPVLTICPAVGGNYSWMQRVWGLGDCYYWLGGMTLARHLSFQRGAGRF